MRMNFFRLLALGLGLILINLASSFGKLEEGFYNGKCGKTNVETTVTKVVTEKFKNDPTIVAALLRMQFHDCFATGCDASLLLDGPTCEKTASPNLSVRGYDVIEDVKTVIENDCSGVVSCADIISLATRDAVALAGGPNYAVQTGRKDSFSSDASNVDLPSSSISVSDSITAFAQRGLNTTDMVLLLGGHTVGITHCAFLQDRLYNFKGTPGKTDPNMDSTLAESLKKTCPQSGGTNEQIPLDQTTGSSSTVDNGFYQQIKNKRGILQIDQDIALDLQTNTVVNTLAMNGDEFKFRFGQAMIKLGSFNVITDDNKGEVRFRCNVTNSASTSTNQSPVDSPKSTNQSPVDSPKSTKPTPLGSLINP